MEYSDDIINMLDSIKESDNFEDKLEFLISLLMTESGKEIYLIFAMYFESNSTINFSFYNKIYKLFCILYSRLINANDFLMNEYFDLTLKLTDNFTDEEMFVLYDKIVNFDVEHRSIYYFMYVYYFKKENDSELAEKILDYDFSALEEKSKFIDILIARAASLCKENNNKLKLEELSLLLIKNNRGYLQTDGITLLSRTENVVNLSKTFKEVTFLCPFLHTQENCRNAWVTVQKFYNKLNQDEKFSVIKDILMDPRLNSSIHQATVNIILKEMQNKDVNVFRSPLLFSLFYLIVPQCYIKSPVLNTEEVILCLNFIRVMLVLDKKYHIYGIFGTESNRKIVSDVIETIKEGIKETIKSDNRPKDVIMKEMEAVDKDKGHDIKSVEELIFRHNMNINRINFSIKELEAVYK